MNTDYRLGDWTIRPLHACIEQGDEVVHLKPSPWRFWSVYVRRKALVPQWSELRQVNVDLFATRVE